MKTAACFSLATAALAGPSLSAATLLATQSSYNTTGINVNTSQAAAFDVALSAAASNGLAAASDLTNFINDDSEFSLDSAEGFDVAFSTSPVMQSAASGGSFVPLTTRAMLQTDDSTGWTATINSSTAPINQVGMTLLPRAHPTYPLDVVVTFTLSDLSTQTIDVDLGNSTGGGTFIGFAADPGLSITSFSLDTFANGTTTPVSTRVAIDQIGFIAIPEPASFVLLMMGAGLLTAGRRRR
ncbi:MAG: PEP-CTERM sorting domain-containing protein [Planctomycetota bacterium]